MSTGTMAVRILSAGVAVLTLGGCSTFLGPDHAGGNTAGRSRCGELLTKPKDEAEQRHMLVILADNSASAVSMGAGTRRRQDWAGLVGPSLPRDKKTLVRWGVFGGDVEWSGKKVTPGASANEYRSQYDAEKVPECLEKELRKAFDIAPARAGTDILRALSEAGNELGGAEGDKQIVIATDGLGNTGCADLRAAPIGDHSAISGIVRACGPEIPRLGKDVQVRLIGIGKPASGWPDVRTPHRVWLVELWSRLCAATGARCVPPRSQAPDQSEVGPDVRPPADPAVEMPSVKIDRGVNPAVITAPESVLFDVDSARLAVRAQDAIDKMMAYIDGFDYRKIVVRGHTDAQGTPDHNQVLSTARAKAVVSALRTRGVRKLTAIGFGERKPRCEPQYRNGVPDLRAMACNRRVEIVVYH
ncbi:OmpA family protein [Sphaerisporangium sp. B11E5]|uniref:OmpA family protein n=1 Tax=Sphaerisporangium sp. B11E5 TaxID=3153563 RepID=UPI00325E43CF